MDEHDQILEQWNFKKVKIGNLVYPLYITDEMQVSGQIDV